MYPEAKMEKRIYQILAAGIGEKAWCALGGILPGEVCCLAAHTRTAEETRQALSASPADIVIINSPLPDCSGVELALELAESAMGILLLTKPEQYETVSLDDFVKYSMSMFEYWTEDDFASSFWKMLTIEQFRSEEMQKLYQQYLAAGPASYVKDLFESMEIADSAEKAIRFYAMMHFYYSVYDGAEDKEQVKEEFETALNCMVQEF